MSLNSIGSSTKVLVVEDEMLLRMRAVDIVEDAGFTAVEAINADEALTRMMRTLGQQLSGNVQLTYATTGFVYLLDVP